MTEKEKRIWLENKKKEILESVSCSEESNYAQAYCNGIDCAISLLNEKESETTKDVFVTNENLLS